MTITDEMVERVAKVLDRMLPTDASQLRQQDLVRIAAALAEPFVIERIHELEAGFNSACVLLRKVEAERDAIRAKTIEECAQIACDHGVVGIAEAIRGFAQVEERKDAT